MSLPAFCRRGCGAVCRVQATVLPYTALSVPVSLARSADAQTLPLFGSLASTGTADAQQAPPAKRHKVSSSDSDVGHSWVGPAGRTRDAVFHVGGPVWAMDWCPDSSSSSRAADGGNAAPPHGTQYLAVRRLPAAGQVASLSGGACSADNDPLRGFVLLCSCCSPSGLQAPHESVLSSGCCRLRYTA